MSQEFNDLPDQEKLKAENEFLKMKLMLEKGAEFGTMESGDMISPEMENDFLKYIAEFERQSENPKYITVYDKIERPSHFKPVVEIPDEEMDAAWNKLSDYLNSYAIRLDACSPNISTRELYRFTIEELFNHEMDDMDIPGMQTGFIYDEFHPDPVYDNSRLVEQDVLGDIFRKEDLFCKIYYAKDGFIFNNQAYSDFTEYFKKISRFKSLFDEIKLLDSHISNCLVNEDECHVKGVYKASAKEGKNEIIYAGEFDVKLVVGSYGYWELAIINIAGFDPS